MENISTISDMDLNITFISVIVFIVIVIIYSIFSVILTYHWRQYAVGEKIITKTLRGYFISTGALLFLALGSLFFI